ncbi:MAG TPA: phosphoenolpyruvate synthase [Frankiaceae bacterium]|nr:phosphoenolpyruvate synthase [Frankiaceae bacterium]
MHTDNSRFCRRLDEIGNTDVGLVGGKNASLGEMLGSLTASGIRVPAGFASTSDAYWEFLDAADLRRPIAEAVGRYRDGRLPLGTLGLDVRTMLLNAPIPPAIADALIRSYEELGNRLGSPDPDVAVRSSATAEDLPDASFAGQQESYLHIRGTAELLNAWRQCVASLFTDRAISYRESNGFGHLDVALSVGVQQMVRSDVGSSGVAFTLDPESGFPNVVVIDAAWGLGESVVGGTVDPDEYVVFKPALADPGTAPVLKRRRGQKEVKVVYNSQELDAGDAGGATVTIPTSELERTAWTLDEAAVLQIARWAVEIERHYGRPMDIEWARDGESGELFIVQARPETVNARRESALLRSYRLLSHGERLLTGLAVGQAVATGPVVRVSSPEDFDSVPHGAVVVTRVTDPDWLPVMKRAAALVTDHGGRTSHAAIVSRELGLPAVVGTGTATSTLVDGQQVTVSCVEGEQGVIYAGAADVEEQDLDLGDLPQISTKIMLNLASPVAAMRWWRLPADGIGLLRMEFLVTNTVKVHPMALAHPELVEDADEQATVRALLQEHGDAEGYMRHTLASGIAEIAASRWPEPVTVRMSDFKTNEYANLLGGRAFEPVEANPMLGWRGASRYYDPGYRDGFALECRALRHVREVLGLTNVRLMIPFCRTVEEADKVLAVLADEGLRRGENGLEIYVMAEIPSNILLAGRFAERFDGFSIGSNDLTQLTLGVDRDSDRLAGLFDESDAAVEQLITHLIRTAHEHGVPVGLCGQRPSNDPSFAAFLVRHGIDSISVTPDSYLSVRQIVADAEKANPILPLQAGPQPTAAELHSALPAR